MQNKQTKFSGKAQGKKAAHDALYLQSMDRQLMQKKTKNSTEHACDKAKPNRLGMRAGGVCECLFASHDPYQQESSGHKVED